METPDAYRAYLLRAWRDVDQQTGTAGPWRFSLERPGSPGRRGFRSLAELTAHFNLHFNAVERRDGALSFPDPDRDLTE